MIPSTSYAAALITKLKQEKYISVRCGGGCKGYVLRAKGKQYLLNHYSADVGYFLQGAIETNHVKSEPEKRLRLHRMSKAWIFFWKMGISVFQSEKPNFFRMHKEKREGNQTAYFGSLEFKTKVDMVKGSRACGLLTGEAVYVVYHSMAQKMKWAKKMERSMRVWVERQFFYSGTADAIIIGDTIDFMLELLESDGGIRKNLFQIDDVFEQYFYLPMIEETQVQIELLTKQRKREALYQFLAGALERREPINQSVCAGYDAKGSPVFFCYELEMRHLLRIKQEMEWKQSGTVWCFEYQAKALEKYFNGKIELREIDTSKVIKYLQQLD